MISFAIRHRYDMDLKLHIEAHQNLMKAKNMRES